MVSNDDGNVVANEFAVFPAGQDVQISFIFQVLIAVKIHAERNAILFERQFFIVLLENLLPVTNQIFPRLKLESYQANASAMSATVSISATLSSCGERPNSFSISSKRLTNSSESKPKSSIFEAKVMPSFPVSRLMTFNIC